MSLRRKAIIFFMSFFVLWFIFVVFYLMGKVQSGYDDLEAYRFNWQVKRVEYGINEIFVKHEKLLLDWAKWDDTYKYVQFPNNLYLAEIVESNHFEDQEMNYYAFYDVSGKLIHAEGYDLEMHRKKEVPSDLIDLLSRYKNQKGLLLIDGRPIVFVTHEVTDNKGLEPPMGLLAFAYELTDTTFMEMSDRLQEQVTIKNLMYVSNGEAEKVDLLIDPHYNESHAYMNMPYKNEDVYLRLSVDLDHAIARFGVKNTNQIVIIFSIAFIFLVAVILYAVNNIVKRIGLLNKELLRIHDYKHLDERIQLVSDDEIGSVRDHINELLDELQDAQHQLIHHATYDILTGVFNRRVGIERLEKTIADMNEVNKPLTIAFVDVDELKVVNDMFGHSVGDDYLIHVCSALKSVVASRQTIARLGGDEFIMIFPDQQASDVQKLLHPVDDKINEIRNAYDLPYEMGISIGIFQYKRGMSVDTFIEEADQKMYIDKLRHREQKR